MLHVCLGCQRHIRLLALACPFCFFACHKTSAADAQDAAQVVQRNPVPVYGGPPPANNLQEQLNKMDPQQPLVLFPDDASTQSGGLGSLRGEGGISTAGVYGGPPLTNGPRINVAVVVTQDRGVASDARKTAGLRPAFAACANSDAVSPTAGVVTLKINVQATGQVTDVTAADSSLPPSEVDCLKTRVQRAMFDEGAAGTLTVKITQTKVE